MATAPQIGLVITGDATQLVAAANAAQKAMGDMGKKTTAQFAKDTQAMADSATKMTRQAQWQTFQLYQQIQDVGVQIAGGQNPVLALLQQGSQLTAIYGSAGAAMRAALGAVVSPAAMATAAVAALGYAFYRGDQQSADFRRSLQLTNGALGLTEGAFNQLTVTVGKATGEGPGTVRDFGMALANTGRFGGQAFADITAMAVRMSALTGQSIDATVQSMVNMQDAPAAWAAQQNKQLHFMTDAQLQYVQRLEAFGKREEAVGQVREALAKRLPQTITENLGYVETATKKLASLAGSMWDAILGVGRDKTAEDNLKPFNDMIDRLEKDPIRFNRLMMGGQDKSGELRDELIKANKARAEPLQAIVSEEAAKKAAAQAKADEERRKGEARELNSRLRPLREALEIARSEFTARSALRDVEAQRFGIARQMAATESPLLQAYLQEEDVQRELLGIAIERQKLVDQLSVNERKPVNKPEDQLQKDAQRLSITSQIADVDEKSRQARLSAEDKIFTSRQKQTEQDWQRLSAIEQANQGLKDQLTNIGDLTRAQAFENSLIGLSPDREQAMRSAREADLFLTKELLNITRQLDEGRINEAQAILQGSAVRTSAASLRAQQLFAERDQLARVYDAQRGVTDAVRDWGETVRQEGRAAYDATRSVVGALEDDLINVFKNGEFSAKRFTDTLINEMLRLKVVRPIIQNALGAGGTDIMSAIFGSRSTNTGLGTDTSRSFNANTNFSGGGWTGSGSRSGGLDGQGGFLAMLHPKESIFDHHKGTGVATMAGGGGGGKVTVNVINQTSADVQTSESTGADGGRVIEVLVGAVKASISQDLFNRTGTMTRAVKSVFA